MRNLPLAIIVIAQLLGASIWFSVNGVALPLADAIDLDGTGLGLLTISVQLGFIVGTITIATTGLADRFLASHVFFVSAVLGALINAAFVLVADVFWLAMMTRFLTGFCLAGIYPLGMKLVVSWTPKYAGAALAWLVGMLTLGTALPHLLRGVTFALPWQWPVLMASALALIAGLMILWLGTGPHLPGPARGGRPWDGLLAFRFRNFRAASLAYFGHCWELYALWTLVPFLVARELTRLGMDGLWLPWLAFAIIALGMPGCVIGGRLSRRWTSFNVARWSLIISGSLCLVYPLLGGLSPALLMLLLIIWGLTVVTDSPQFSALASATAPRERLGGSLAIMNAIGFAMTLPAIAITMHFWEAQGLYVLWWLLPGPVLGLIAFHRMNRGELREI
ncbi:MFS family permease [Natronocella acetinitrilica]|uniref:MFS family permease n=1 Tax=Natronocella acetinitrilica TaxID=414046 RepID=A0AAE3G651_9GAMM|nr:MFS transporter [Natronocella acetinitrilica]MCP1675764.1 MFS family permease [Natronocella acetinitrilica]